MFGYRTNRYAKIKKLRADLAKLTSEQNKNGNVEAEAARLARMIPAEANGPAFVEALYRCARESGLKQHEVATEGVKTQETARPGAAKSTSIATHRIKVSAGGSYRSFAEYLRRVQNIERFNRIIDFKLAPDADQIKGTLTIELYYLPVKNAK
jgi:Tfp pilus assembly protein PilO